MISDIIDAGRADAVLSCKPYQIGSVARGAKKEFVHGGAVIAQALSEHAKGFYISEESHIDALTMTPFFPLKMRETMTHVFIEKAFPSNVMKYLLKTIVSSFSNLEFLSIKTSDFSSRYLEWVLKRLNKSSTLKEITFTRLSDPNSFQVRLNQKLIQALKVSPFLLFNGDITFSLDRETLRNEFDNNLENAISSLFKTSGFKYYVYCGHNEQNNQTIIQTRIYQKGPSENSLVSIFPSLNIKDTP